MLARWEAHKRKYFANLPRELTSVQQRGRSVNQYPELPRGPSREVFASDRRVHAVSSPNRTSSRVLNVNSTNPATESSTQRSQGSATSHGRVFAHQLCGRWTCYLKSKITPKTHKAGLERRHCFYSAQGVRREISTNQALTLTITSHIYTIESVKKMLVPPISHTLLTMMG